MLAALLPVAILAAAALAAIEPGRERRATGAPLLGRPIRADGPPAAAASPPAPPHTVLQASEAFAAGYVAFLASREPAAAVANASGTLRKRLALLRPHVPTAAGSGSNPRLTSVRVVAAGRATATSTAVIEDGGVLDPLTLRLARRAGAWVVVDLAETG